MRTEAHNFHSMATSLFGLLALAFTAIPASTATAMDVSIPDPGLEAAIRDALAKPSGAITDTDLAGLTVLAASIGGITDLTGLEYCVNMLDLRLSSNSISDLGPLSGLTSLETLILNHNSISNLLPLAGLTNLTFLSIHGNSISDLSPLAGLINLDELTLSANDITDLGPLAGLSNLTVLHLSNNNISDLGPLSGLNNLLLLWISQNSISDLGPLSGLTSLRFLFLNHNSISNLGPLSGLINLDMLELHGNNVSNLRPLTGLAKLAVLELRENNIRNLDPLSGLTNLFDLFLEDNNVSDIQPLVDNPGMDAGDYIMLRRNPLNCKAITTDIPILEGRGATVLFNPWATLNVGIHPRVLNINSKGKWVTCWIFSCGGCNLREIDVDSIRLEDSLEVQRSHFLRWLGVLTVRFNRSEVQAMLSPDKHELTVTGEFTSGLEFRGTDTIRMVDLPTW